ncbi:hypothetical protein Ddc_10848 [Ditylenchus destructor]|nr:hypothetical protein Ddc_10848 [Ditylenchus destructor]
MGDAITVNRLKLFFDKNGISTKNVAIVTIQKNRTTEFSTLVANFDACDVIPNYPIPQDYREMSLPKGLPMSQCQWNIAYKEALPVPQFNRNEPNKVFSKPFCCSGIAPYKARNVSLEGAFRDFVNGSGDHQNIVFEVKCQIDNGPVLYTDYFQLTDNKVAQVMGPFTNKKHTFKNYKCQTHNLFYGVDVYDKGNVVGHNFHHMRLNPFTKINAELMEEFFRSAEV